MVEIDLHLGSPPPALANGGHWSYVEVPATLVGASSSASEQTPNLE
jgi:hypothetical protein